MQIGICEFIKTNGARCGSPALRGQHYCYFHRQSSEPSPAIGEPELRIPVLEDAETIQVLLSKIVQGLASGAIEPARAKSLIYALQVASQNLKHVNFKPFIREVVTDANVAMLFNRWLQHPSAPRPVLPAPKRVSSEVVPSRASQVIAADKSS